MLRAIIILSFITIVFVGLYQYTNKISLDIETDITKNIRESLANSGVLNREDTQVFIIANGRDITLNGNTSSTKIRTNISDIARSVSGVRSLSNKMNITSSPQYPTYQNIFTPDKKEDTTPKKGLSFSNIFTPEEETPTTTPITDKNAINDTTTIKPPIVLDIIKCDPEVCENAKSKDTIKSQKTKR